jgi:hypothetical protein
MVDFVLKPKFYDRLPAYLLDSVVGFRDSPEFATVAEFQDLPGVICGALGQFLARLQVEAETGNLDVAGREELESAYRAIDAMAGSEDPEVQNAVQVEIFETLSDGSTLWETIQANLLPTSKALLERWPV